MCYTRHPNWRIAPDTEHKAPNARHSAAVCHPPTRRPDSRRPGWLSIHNSWAILQYILELFERRIEACFSCVGRNVLKLGDLVEGQALIDFQFHHAALLRIKLLQQLQDVLILLFSLHMLGWPAVSAGRLRQSVVAHMQHGAGPSASNQIDGFVVGNTKGPTAELGFAAEAVQVAVNPHEYVLHKIQRVVGMTGQAQTEVVDTRLVAAYQCFPGLQ